jgi:hypothetical protein
MDGQKAYGNRVCIGYPIDGAQGVGTSVDCSGCRRPVTVGFYARLMSAGGQVNASSFIQDTDGHFTYHYDGLTAGAQYQFAVAFDSTFTQIADAVMFTA